GIGTGYAAMPALIARSVAVDQLGSAVSFNQVLRTVGGAIGAALSAAVLAAHPSGDSFSTDAGITGAFGVGVICCAAVMVALVLNALRGRQRRVSTPAPEAGSPGPAGVSAPPGPPAVRTSILVVAAAVESRSPPQQARQSSR